MFNCLSWHHLPKTLHVFDSQHHSRFQPWADEAILVTFKQWRSVESARCVNLKLKCWLLNTQHHGKGAAFWQKAPKIIAQKNLRKITHRRWFRWSRVTHNHTNCTINGLNLGCINDWTFCTSGGSWDCLWNVLAPLFLLAARNATCTDRLLSNQSGSQMSIGVSGGSRMYPSDLDPF